MDAIDGPVFELQWEQKPGIDSCAHDWEQLHVRPYPGARLVDVERCTKCGVPRCESSSAEGRSPCVDRRHHHGMHIYEDGSFGPLGGYLP